MSVESEAHLAAARLFAGEVVAFPTDTVYGLGADAMQADAVERLFILKGRPSTRPLSILVADRHALEVFAASLPDGAQALAAAYWPGALTLVVPVHSRVPRVVTAGGNTIGLRMPDHPLALALIRSLGSLRGEPGGVAAPSANRFGAPPPTTADEVFHALPDAEILILDGGPCRHGQPSTVVDVSGEAPRVVRQGALAVADIETVIGPVLSPP
jgi:L-threonylcarbamoyladenylate synthase